MTLRIAVDPGINGAIAWIDPDGYARAEKMPECMSAQADFVRSLAASSTNWTAILEKTGTYQPGNSGPGAVTFARHCGNLEAILYCLGIPTEQVAPSKWQAGLGKWSKEKAVRKREIKEAMSRRYPYLKVTLSTADALGILTYSINQKNI